jgi:hypothetical protein
MDEADRAQNLEEQERERALLLRKPQLQAIGYCHFCSEDVPHGKLFCDAACRDCWQEEQDAKKRNGGN